MNLQKALLLDFDGTIRYSKSGRDFIKNVDDIAIYPDVLPVLKDYTERGWLILGITNQGGVAFGYRTIDQAIEETHHTINLLVDEQKQPYFKAVEACFFHPKGTVPAYSFDSIMRKPNPGMLASLETTCLTFMRVMIDWPRSLMVGDRRDDAECARRGGVPFEWAQVFFNRAPFQVGQRVRLTRPFLPPAGFSPDSPFTVYRVEWRPDESEWHVNAHLSDWAVEGNGLPYAYGGPASDFRPEFADAKA